MFVIKSLFAPKSNMTAIISGQMCLKIPIKSSQNSMAASVRQASKTSVVFYSDLITLNEVRT